MKTVATCLNILSIAAFVTALVTAVVSLSYLESEQGMIPVTMLLALALWSLPALVLAIVAFVTSLVITARESAKVLINNCETSPRGTTYLAGQGLVVLGVFIVAWSTTTRTRSLASGSEVLADYGTTLDLMLLVYMLISVLASAIPGLLVCLTGYWLMRPPPDFDETPATA